jgi:hypothetical protein
VNPAPLTAQLDSALCAASPHKIDDYLAYDFVGAPWPHNYPAHNPGCGNGGLSLRRRSAMLRVLDHFKASGGPSESTEDLAFCEGLKAVGAALPSHEVSRTFAVEMEYYEQPLGLHQHWRFDFHSPEQRAHLFNYCPEAMVALPSEIQLPSPEQRTWRLAGEDEPSRAGAAGG